MGDVVNTSLHKRSVCGIRAVFKIYILTSGKFETRAKFEIYILTSEKFVTRAEGEGYNLTSQNINFKWREFQSHESKYTFQIRRVSV